LEAGVVNGYFPLHAPKPPTETSIETAERLEPSRGSCHSVMEAA
jgi:hypothetical protein